MNQKPTPASRPSPIPWDEIRESCRQKSVKSLSEDEVRAKNAEFFQTYPKMLPWHVRMILAAKLLFVPGYYGPPKKDEVEKNDDGAFERACTEMAQLVLSIKEADPPCSWKDARRQVDEFWARHPDVCSTSLHIMGEEAVTERFREETRTREAMTYTGKFKVGDEVNVDMIGFRGLHRGKIVRVLSRDDPKYEVTVEGFMRTKFMTEERLSPLLPSNPNPDRKPPTSPVNKYNVGDPVLLLTDIDVPMLYRQIWYVRQVYGPDDLLNFEYLIGNLISPNHRVAETALTTCPAETLRMQSAPTKFNPGEVPADRPGYKFKVGQWVTRTIGGRRDEPARIEQRCSPRVYEIRYNDGSLIKEHEDFLLLATPELRMWKRPPMITVPARPVPAPDTVSGEAFPGISADEIRSIMSNRNLCGIGSVDFERIVEAIRDGYCIGMARMKREWSESEAEDKG